MKAFPILICLFGFCLFSSCHQKEESISLKDYYFPSDSLEDGMVYIYKMEKGFPNPYDFWFYKSFEEDGKLFLTAQQYDEFNNVRQFQLQEITASGAMLDQNIFYGVDSLGKAVPIPCSIIEDSHFPFMVKDTMGIFLSSMSYIDQSDSTKVTLIRNRRYWKDTTFLYEGNLIPAIIMEVKEAYDYDREGILTIRAKGHEMYAKGIGLVSSSKFIQDSIELSFKLDKLVDMEDFLKSSFDK